MDLSDLSFWLRGPALEAVLLVVGAVLLVRSLRALLRRVTPRTDLGDSIALPDKDRFRRAAIQAVERAVVGTLWLLTGILVLERLALPIATLVAPATVVGAAIGFGSRQVVADFLSGFFLITERQFGFGDEVRIGPPGTTEGVTATVEEVTLRFTRFRMLDGASLFLPNNEIRQVVNRAKVIDNVEVDVPVPPEVELTNVIDELGRSMAELGADGAWEDRLLDGPVIAGVEDVSLDRIDLRVTAKANPIHRADVARELRRRAALATAAAAVTEA